jgi:hypothetical protein
LLRVVDSVWEPKETGVARPLAKGEFFVLTALMAARERRCCCRLSASRREAIAGARVADGQRGAMGDGGEGGWRVDDVDGGALLGRAMSSKMRVTAAARDFPALW